MIRALPLAYADNVTSQSRATFYALIAVLCWSTVATAFKLGLQYFTPLQLITLASAVALLFLLGLLAWQGELKQLVRQPAIVYLHSLGYAVLNPVLYYLILFQAYDQLPAQEAQALNYSWAIMLSLLAVPMLGHRLGRFDVLAAVICYAGVLVIATRGNVFDLEFSNAYGVALALLTTLIWPVYWILNRRDQRPPIMGLALNFMLAVPILLMIMVLSDQHSGLTQTVLAGWLAAAYVGLVELGLGFVFWLMAMKAATNTARIANLIFLAPFVSLIFITTILDEPLYSSTLVGLALIVAGLLLQQRLGIKLNSSQNG